MRPGLEHVEDGEEDCGDEDGNEEPDDAQDDRGFDVEPASLAYESKLPGAIWTSIRTPCIRAMHHGAPKGFGGRVIYLRGSECGWSRRVVATTKAATIE
jgi:hypothetical protein